jgi:ABC-type thiamine transport system ATPase subunit
VTALKLSIRTEGSTIRAYVATPDGSKRTEVATLDAGFAAMNPDMRDRWVSLLSEAFEATLRSMGLPVSHMVTVIRPDGGR